jgi:glycosyltransferase involved in cell wall biosynthesis
MRLSILRKAKYVIVASRELQSILEINHLSPFLVPTTSTLAPRDKGAIVTKKCSLLSVFDVYPRKNVPLLESLQNRCNEYLKVRFETKVGRQLLSLDEYTSLFDDHEIYVCTSYQEGGPIPAMDAMQRGLAIVSTPVGQLRDLIKHGESGYICETEEEFIRTITVLANDLPLLQRMRINALESIQTRRNVDEIKAKVLSIISEARSLVESTTEKKRWKMFGVSSWLFHSSVYRLGSGPLGTRMNALRKKLQARR